ncbi:MAG: HDOD domain-containing protein [Chloroflexota bacterium]|nr:HDOD domain-containing protein [Chloroflexota bacterium]
MIERAWSEARRLESWPPPSLSKAIASAGSVASSTSFVARQPIYDANLEVYAYELLFRDGDVDHADISDQEAATASTVVTTFSDIGLDALVGGRCAFVNTTRDFVMRDFVTLLPAGRVVLELHRGEALDPEVLAELRRLVELGYLIALDDFVIREDSLPLLEVAHFVKFDVQAFTRDQLAEQVQALRSHEVSLIASKIEDHHTFEACKELGFDHFQGYFFCQPKTVTGKGIPSNRLTQMRLMTVLQDPHCELEELERSITNDLGVSFRLLRWINSAYFSLPRKVNSVREALVLLGVRNVRSWALLMTLAAIDDQPSELIRTAMVRAKMCELIARAIDRPDPDAHFTVGLFSVVDAFMNMRMEDVLSELPLSPEVAGALRDQSGPLGEVLSWVLTYERGRFECLEPAPEADAMLRDAYLVALRFAEEAETASV